MDMCSSLWANEPGSISKRSNTIPCKALLRSCTMQNTDAPMNEWLERQLNAEAGHTRNKWFGFHFLAYCLWLGVLEFAPASWQWLSIEYFNEPRELLAGLIGILFVNLFVHWEGTDALKLNREMLTQLQHQQGLASENAPSETSETPLQPAL